MVTDSYLARSALETRVEQSLARSPVTALLGPRQCGKTTLARRLAAKRPSTMFDLESPADRARLQNPEMALGSLGGLVVLDEIQAAPELFPVLRVLADRPDRGRRFLILGSASPHLRGAASETLAGRVEFIDIAGFTVSEVGVENQLRRWVRGGFPRSYLAATEDDSVAWREGFVRTFLERDLPQFGVRTSASTMRRFWTMLAHYHGQTWNSSEIARAFGTSDKTVRSYLDVLTDTFVVRQLQPWYASTAKRQVRAPKVYIRDTGLLHSLLGLPDYQALLGHPKVGASWEGFAIEEIASRGSLRDTYFWSVHTGAELDLLANIAGKPIGFEFKFTESPRATRSMRTSIDVLGLDQLWIVTPSGEPYEISPRIRVGPLAHLLSHWPWSAGETPVSSPVRAGSPGPSGR